MALSASSSPAAAAVAAAAAAAVVAAAQLASVPPPPSSSASCGRGKTMPAPTMTPALVSPSGPRPPSCTASRYSTSSTLRLRDAVMRSRMARRCADTNPTRYGVVDRPGVAVAPASASDSRTVRPAATSADAALVGAGKNPAAAASAAASSSMPPCASSACPSPSPVSRCGMMWLAPHTNTSPSTMAADVRHPAAMSAMTGPVGGAVGGDGDPDGTLPKKLLRAVVAGSELAGDDGGPPPGAPASGNATATGRHWSTMAPLPHWPCLPAPYANRRPECVSTRV